MRSEAPASAPWWRRQLNAAFRMTSVASGRFPISYGFAVATCALVPAYTIRWHIGPLPTTLLEGAILFLIAGAISVVAAPDHRAALGLYRAYFIEPIAFGAVLINVIKTPIRALWVVVGLSLGATVAGV